MSATEATRRVIGEVSGLCAAATAATAAASSASGAVHGEVHFTYDLMHVKLLGEAAEAATAVATETAVASEVVQNGGEAETDMPPTQNYEGEPPQVQPQSSQAWSACSSGTEMGKREVSRGQTGNYKGCYCSGTRTGCWRGRVAGVCG